MMRRFAIAPLAVVALAIAGCGGSSSSGDQAAFDWLQPGPPPPSWKLAPLPDRSATMAYPPGWHREHSDPGTVTAVLEAHHAPLAGYLNTTQQQGAETFDNWADFRLEHNAEEGDRHVREVASATGVAFREGAVGSCVIDDYVTESDHSYREIACLVGSAKATNVIVGAAPPSRWKRVGPLIERAVSSFRT
jgi:hypothetical protein